MAPLPSPTCSIGSPRRPARSPAGLRRDTGHRAHGPGAPDLAGHADDRRCPSLATSRCQSGRGRRPRTSSATFVVELGLEVLKFHSPPVRDGDGHAPPNTLGIRRIAFAVNDIDAAVAGLRARGTELIGEVEQYQDSYRLCYVRAPEGIILMLSEELG